MGKVSPELIQAQALELRGAKLDPERAQQLAADIANLNEAALAARELLDFNDEPARFAALLRASAAPDAKRK